MKTTTVNLSFNKDLLKHIDQVAQIESRSRSELIREAVRMYIERKDKWKNIFNYGEKVATEQNLVEEDVLSEIKKYRREKNNNSV